MLSLKRLADRKGLVPSEKGTSPHSPTITRGRLQLIELLAPRYVHPADIRFARPERFAPLHLSSFFRSSHVVSKGNRVRTDLTSFDPCELLRRSTELPLFSFRSFPHEVPTAGDKLRIPRVLFAIIERLEARDACENALWRSAARDPIARHQRCFASCDFASARVLRVLLNANLSQIFVSLRLLSRLCVSGRSRRGVREVRGAARRTFVYICTRATAAFATNARSRTFFQVWFTRFYSLRVRPFALRLANISRVSRLCATLPRAVFRA